MNKDEIKVKFNQNMQVAKKIGIWFVGILVVLFVIIGISGSKTQPKNTSSTTSQTTSNVGYEEIARTKNGEQENISILVKVGETNLENVALEVKKSCKKYCNISLYDDRKAYDLDKQYTDMMGSYDTKQEDLTKWKENNYVFVADHLIATVGYGNTDGWGFGPFKSYPMKDWYYNERKDIN